MKTHISIKPFNENGVKVLNEVTSSLENEDMVNNKLLTIYGGGAHFSFNSVSSTGIERIGGVSIDYRYYLKKILVKQWGEWKEYYAPNKTILRKCLYGNIQAMLYI